MTNANQNVQQVSEKVIDKIRKLLAHANDTAADSENERDTAMRMALKLLAKHNLQLKDITDLDQKEDRDMVEFEAFPCPFRRVVANAIAELYFCKFYRTKVPNKQKYMFSFVGLESNCNTAAEIAKYVIKSLDLESAKLLKANGKSTRWGTDFRNAAAVRISQRCLEMRQDAEKEEETATPGTALVLASLYDQEKADNEKYITNILGIKLKETTVKFKPKLASAVVQGTEYGDKVNLSSNLVGSNGQDTQAPQLS